MAITANDLRKGMVIIYNGELCQVIDVEFVRPGNWRAMAQAKLKSLKTGSIFMQRYQTTEKVDEATVEIENIHTQYARSPSIAWAVRRGNAQTAIPRLMAMLCILAVFIPSFFMQGAARALFLPLATLAEITAYPRARALSSIARSREAEKGFATSFRSNPRVRVPPAERRKVLAVKFGR